MESTKLSIATSLHLAIFAAGAAANSSVGEAFVLGGFSSLILILTLSYELLSGDRSIFYQ